MPENEARRIPGAEELRNLVERREREELRDDLARTLREGIGTDELGDALRRLIRQSLEEVVQQALDGERVHKVIERHVTDRILTGVAGELRDAQQELLAKARADLAKTWRKEASEILLVSLRKEVVESVRRGIREGVLDVDFRRELLNALRATQEERLPEAPSPTSPKETHPDTKPESNRAHPPVIRSKRWRPPSFSSFLPALRKRPGAWIGGGAALILVGLAVPVWFVIRSQERALPGHLVEQTPSLSTVATPQPVDSLREIWMERMTNRKLTPFMPTEKALALYSFEEQFDCWFDPDVLPRLDDLLETSRSGDPRENLRWTFAPCVEERYSGKPGDRLPILGAQAIVLDSLRRHASEDWQDCRRPPDLQGFLDPDYFRIDGEPGRRTEELLNSYLASCTRVSSLRIHRESTIPEYLFVLYAALKDLEEQGSP